ncbi:MAG: hypothetical protein LBC93_08355 [Synergistaceae bacterium]|jgi:hypothetical protein|nr:hypothetical protein [Synergistaceae bacterium]
MAVIENKKSAQIILALDTKSEGFGRWTVRSLTNKIELDIAPGISRETVRRVLKKLNLRKH